MSVGGYAMISSAVGGCGVTAMAAAFRRSSSVETRDESGSESGAMSSHDEEVIIGGTRSGGSSKSVDGDDQYESSSSRQRHGHHGDPEKRIRREIANSNERRRMQSINAGFQSLRDLVRPRSGDKLSKAAILQHAVDYISDLHRQKKELVAKNARLMQLLANGGNYSAVNAAAAAAEAALPVHTGNGNGSQRGRRQCDRDEAPSPPPATKRRRPEASTDESRHHRGRSASTVHEVAAPEVVIPRRMPSMDEMAIYQQQVALAGNVLVTSGLPEPLSVVSYGQEPEDRTVLPLEVVDPSAELAARLKAEAEAVTGVPTLIATTDLRPFQVLLDAKDELKPDVSLVTSAAATLNAWTLSGNYVGILPSWSAQNVPTVGGNGVDPWGSTSRRNLDTILEAIRHLEGDQALPTVVDEEEVVAEERRRRNSSTPSPFTPVKACVSVRSS